MDKIFVKINLLWATVLTFLTSAFGAYWYIFAAFMVLNVVDFFTGVEKAKYSNTENSNKGAKGVIKKLGYWIVIYIAFFMSYTFKDIGNIIGIDLGISAFIGWFVLATFIINEIRSIIENLIEIGVDVPKFLTKGLEVASKKLDDMTDEGDKNEDNK